MKFRTKIAAVVTSAAVAGVAGIAFAAWNSTVDGTGSAQSTTADEGGGDLAAVAPVAADDLYPGAVKATQVTIDNDNDYPIEVLQIHAGSSRAVDTCDADTVRTDVLGTGTAAVTKVGGGTVIDAGGTGTFELVLRMNNNASDDCQDKTFVIGEGGAPTSDLIANVRSAASTTGNSW